MKSACCSGFIVLFAVHSGGVQFVQLSTLLGHLLREIAKLTLFQFLGDGGINIKGDVRPRVTAEVLNHLDVNTGLHQPRSKGVTQGVAAEIGQKNRVLLARVQLSLIAVPDDAPQSLVQCTLMLYRTKGL